MQMLQLCCKLSEQVQSSGICTFTDEQLARFAEANSLKETLAQQFADTIKVQERKGILSLCVYSGFHFSLVEGVWDKPEVVQLRSSRVSVGSASASSAVATSQPPSSPFGASVARPVVKSQLVNGPFGRFCASMLYAVRSLYASDGVDA
jgi:hypothetical protein